LEREELQQLIASAATLAAATILDNYIRNDAKTPYSEGERSMASKKRFHITLPTGEKVWISGDTVSDAFISGMQRYGSLYSASVASSNTPRFDIYAKEWLTTYKKPKLRQTTYRTYENQLAKHIVPFFGDMDVGAITTGDIQRFFNAKGDMSKSSVRQMRIILHEIFSGAIEDGYRDKDPTESKRLSLPERVTEREALSTNDYSDIIKDLCLLEEKDALLLALLMFTGMRRGEVLGLCWEDIDDSVIHIRRSVTFKGNQPIVGKTKSKAGIRDIPISHQLRPYLAKRSVGYVIGGGDEPITESTFDRAWQRIERTIDLHGATPHVFRHTYLTHLASTGATVKTIQAIAGHADIQTTMNRYVHRRSEDILDAGKKFGELTFC